jgi:hypothetical protein
LERTVVTMKRWVAVAVALVFGVVGVTHPSRAGADGHRAVEQPRYTPAVQSALTALDRLHQYGYQWTTDAGAARAVRHWQRVNGLTVDGIVGPETMASLDLSLGGPSQGAATATQPADRRLPVAAVDPEAIIRELWPDDSEDRAVQIAMRESRLQPDARNACCYGLFQIHYTAHRSWLAAMGVTSPAALLDARTNVTAALALYEAAGWGPWSL